MAGGIEFRIRPFRDGDEDDVVELWRACELVRPWNDPHRDIECARAGAMSEVFVAVAGEGSGRVIGSVMAGYDGHRGWVYYLAAAPEHRSGGLGGRLMRHAESWLEGLGAPQGDADDPGGERRGAPLLRRARLRGREAHDHEPADVRLAGRGIEVTGRESEGSRAETGDRNG